MHQEGANAIATTFKTFDAEDDYVKETLGTIAFNSAGLIMCPNVLLQARTTMLTSSRLSSTTMPTART
jgi:hypothetical protein